MREMIAAPVAHPAQSAEMLENQPCGIRVTTTPEHDTPPPKPRTRRAQTNY